MIETKTIVGAVAIIGAFTGGFRVATWRDEAKDARHEEQIIGAYKDQVQLAIDRANAAIAASEKREAELTAGISTAKQDSEALRHDLDARPVVTRTTATAQCPSVAAVDWRVFQRGFDCAAAPDDKACRAGASGNVVRAAPAATARP